MDGVHVPQREVEMIEVELIKEVMRGGELLPPGTRMKLRPDQVERLLALDEIAPEPGTKIKRAVKEV